MGKRRYCGPQVLSWAADFITEPPCNRSARFFLEEDGALRVQVTAPGDCLWRRVEVWDIPARIKVMVLEVGQEIAKHATMEATLGPFGATEPVLAEAAS